MAKKSMKQYYGTTFVIGLGFFTMGLMDPLYDTYVPVFGDTLVPVPGGGVTPTSAACPF